MSVLKVLLTLTGTGKEMDEYFKALFGVAAPVCRIKKRRNRTWKIRKEK